MFSKHSVDLYEYDRGGRIETLQEGFEGPEKKLEVVFRADGRSKGKGMRTVSISEWEVLLKKAECTILSTMSNDFCDAYVLSESSLFVYHDRVMLKTCGTTSLLRCVDHLIGLAKERGLHVLFVLYCRKNFTFPDKQPAPHRSFSEEVGALNKNFPNGTSFVLGPLNGDHWCFYVADYTSVQHPCKHEVLEIKMHELDASAYALFSKHDGITGSDVTYSSGIADLMPGSITDEFLFEPCGYSMNGLLDENYDTIHVTPEGHCSYASFETNQENSCYGRLVNKVLKIFRPATFTVTRLSCETIPTLPHLACDNYCNTGTTITCLGQSTHVAHWTFVSHDPIYRNQSYHRLVSSVSNRGSMLSHGFISPSGIALDVRVNRTADEGALSLATSSCAVKRRSDSSPCEFSSQPALVSGNPSQLACSAEEREASGDVGAPTLGSGCGGSSSMFMSRPHPVRVVE